MSIFESPSQAHEAKRQELAADVQAYLASGGKIRHLPAGMTPEQREAEQAMPWTNSLGTLSSQARKRKQGEYTVSPGWQYRPKPEVANPRKRAVTITNGDRSKSFPSCAAAGRHIGVTASAVKQAAYVGRAVRGWVVEYVES